MPEPTVRLSSGEPLTWTMRQVFELAVPVDWSHLIDALRAEILREGADLIEHWHGGAPDVYSPQDSADLLRHVASGGNPADATYGHPAVPGSTGGE